MIIYGAGKRGQGLYKKWKNSKMKIEGFIDRRANDIDKSIFCEDIKILTINEAIAYGWQEKTVIISPVACDDIVCELQNLGFQDIICLYDVINDVLSEYLPYYNHAYYMPARDEEGDYRCAVPFNHYESPYADLALIRKNQDKIYNINKEMNINFDIEGQINLLNRMFEIPLLNWHEKEANNGLRYYTDNDMFGISEAAALYGMIMLNKPKHIIEIGSGFSTSVMLDTNEHCFNNEIDIECIEPRPQRLKKLLKESDHILIHENDLQEVPLDLFSKLGQNDILFIDSSHVIKTFSDVSYELFEILPMLSKGVYIHFHDIFWPFEYPMGWLTEGRAYNEQWVLRALLTDSTAYKVTLFGHQLQCLSNAGIIANITPPLKKIYGGSSMWIKKL